MSGVSRNGPDSALPKDLRDKLGLLSAQVADLCSAAGPLYQKAVVAALKNMVQDLPDWLDPEKRGLKLPDQWLPASIESRLRSSMASMVDVYRSCGPHNRDAVLSSIRQKVEGLPGESRIVNVSETKPKRWKHTALP